MDGAKKLIKEAGRAAAKAMTGDEFKQGVKSTFKSAADSTSRSVTGETIKRAAGRLTDSEYVRTAIKPGLKSAFEQAGGSSGIAKRVVGGAALGGATTGTIGALRGNDFWESSKTGVVAGGLGGLGRQYSQMGETEVGSELFKSVSGEFSKARAGANRAQSFSDARKDLGKGYSDTIVSALAAKREKEYAGGSFMKNALGDIKSGFARRDEGPPLEEALNAVRKQSASPSKTPTRKETNASRRGKSNQVVTMDRAAKHQVLSNRVLGNHQGGGGIYGHHQGGRKKGPRQMLR